MDVPDSVMRARGTFRAGQSLEGSDRLEEPMANTPRPAARKRTPPLDRRNAQGDEEGSPHRPEEFDAVNPAKQVPGPVKPDTQE